MKILAELLTILIPIAVLISVAALYSWDLQKDVVARMGRTKQVLVTSGAALVFGALILLGATTHQQVWFGMAVGLFVPFCMLGGLMLVA